MSRDLNLLHPTLKPICLAFLKKCEEQGLDVFITFTYRTPEQQNEIYAQGRTKPGKIVTSLKGNQSKHCFTIDGKPAAKAFDVLIRQNKKIIEDGSDPFYTKIGLIGEALGLTWGGRWKKPFDPGHFEIK